MADRIFGMYPEKIVRLSTETQPLPFALGTFGADQEGNEFVLAQLDAAMGSNTGEGMVVLVDPNDWTAQRSATSAGAYGMLVGALRVTTAMTNGDVVWVQVKGKATVNVSSSAAANAPLATTTTNAEVDDATPSGSFNIVGMALTTAESSGTATAYMSNPYLGSTN